MSDFAISVEGLSKRYRIGTRRKRHDTAYEALASWLRSPVQNYRRLRRLNRFEDEEGEDILWALRDVSFTVDHGEVVGLIGRNGAGKSTLLRILSRITDPTRGRIGLRGRVSSLLEVGTGFHGELTGRENVYLNGAILGMTKAEVDRKFDEIVAFSEVEKFIDTPVKRYSSGMKVRLAFAVAAHLEPDILLVDEVLAVGDVAFQRKCLGKMDDVAGEGRTVIFVSHHMNMIQALCQRGIVLDGGRITVDADTDTAVSRYLRDMASRVVEADLAATAHERAGNGAVRITAIRTLDSEGHPSEHHIAGEGATIEIDYERRALSGRPTFEITLRNDKEVAVTHLNFEMTGYTIPERAERGTVACWLPRLPLQLGKYSISVLVRAGKDVADAAPRAASFNVSSSSFYPNGGLPNRKFSVCMLEHAWSHRAIA